MRQRRSTKAKLISGDGPLSRVPPAAVFLVVAAVFVVGVVVRGVPGALLLGALATEMDWEVQPDGLAELLVSLSREYPGLPLYVTENGAAYPDSFTEDGAIRDTDRIMFLDGHLRACHSAIEQGADLRGYFCWSLLDNLEWAWGYAKRFGLVHVDFQTQKRTPKDSARWYSSVVGRNGLLAADG